MNFTVYSKDGCPYCEKIKEVFDLTKLRYVVYNLDEHFDKKEFIEYYRFMEEKLRNEMGGAYRLTEEELNESHAAHDFDGSGFITKDEVLWSRKMKGKFYKSMRLT